MLTRGICAQIDSIGDDKARIVEQMVKQARLARDFA